VTAGQLSGGSAEKIMKTDSNLKGPKLL